MIDNVNIAANRPKQILSARERRGFSLPALGEVETAAGDETVGDGSELICGARFRISSATGMAETDARGDCSSSRRRNNNRWKAWPRYREAMSVSSQLGETSG